MGNNIGFLWDELIDEMGIEELEQYLVTMKEMRAKATDQYLEMRNCDGGLLIRCRQMHNM